MKRYEHPELKRIAFPLGGLGAGMVCLEGTGALSHFSLHNRPGMTNEPCVFAAVHLAGVPGGTRVIEGQVPTWKIMGRDPGGSGKFVVSAGLPRFSGASFEGRFPFGIVRLEEPRFPLRVTLTGWSPFIPGNADDSSLPAALLEYALENTSKRRLTGTFSFNAENFLSQPQGNFGDPPDSWTTEARADGFVFRAAGGAQYSAPANITIQAVASDQDGTVASVQFYSGMTQIGSVSNAPYNWTWTGVEAGSYTLYAKAVDNQGGAGMSSGVSVTVTNPPGTNVWKMNISFSGYTRSEVLTNFVLQWSSVSGKWYAVDSSTNLMNGFHVNVESNIVATPDVNCKTLQVNQAVQEYFRIRVESR